MTTKKIIRQNFYDCPIQEQVKLDLVISIKKDLNRLEKDFKDKNNEVLNIVKKYKSIIKDEDIITFVEEGQPTQKFNIEDFKNDHPRLYKKYLQEVKGRTEHLQYKV